MNWIEFTRRTDDPKLAYLEVRLTEAGIPHRRNGSSFHAPIMEVPEEREDEAYAILMEDVDVDDDLVLMDDIPDDDTLFARANGDAPYNPHDYLVADEDSCTADCDHEVRVHWTPKTLALAKAQGVL